MKNKRHQAILNLISENEIETQQELAARLNDLGFAVTQATVSRDIKQLRLTKTVSGSGKVSYTSAGDGPRSSIKYIRILRESFVSAVPAASIVVVKTDPGCAMSAAAAIEAWGNTRIIGSIAGDDTIFCAVASEEDAKAVAEELNHLMNE